jgi:hypothetical protein
MAPPSTEQFLMFCQLVSIDRSFSHNNANFNRSLRYLEEAKEILHLLEDVFEKSDISFSLTFVGGEFRSEIPLHILDHMSIHGELINLKYFSDFRGCFLILRNTEIFLKYKEHLMKKGLDFYDTFLEEEHTRKIFFRLKNKNK